MVPVLVRNDHTVKPRYVFADQRKAPDSLLRAHPGINEDACFARDNQHSIAGRATAKYGEFHLCIHVENIYLLKTSLET